MTGFSDLLFLIEEARKQKQKLQVNTHILTRFRKFLENDHEVKKIQQRVNLKFESIPSKSSILNSDLAYKNNRVLLYLKLPKVSGEVVVTFSSNFSIIDVNR